jgi:hypothetical protein
MHSWLLPSLGFVEVPGSLDHLSCKNLLFGPHAMSDPACVYVCVCVYIYIYICVYIYIYVCVCVCVNMLIFLRP